MKKELVCIACPVGCRLAISGTPGESTFSVTGNKCSRGEVYATEEVLAPRRIVTATVAVSGSEIHRMPVKTAEPLPRELIPSLLQTLYHIQVEAPVLLGDTIVHDFEKSGIDVVATRMCRKI